MSYVPIESLLKNTNGSMYKLVILASQRALELGAGSEKLVKTIPNTKITSIALKEIVEQKITFRDKKK